jgi:tetratricopeptide (TPR) repeat protein
MAGDYQPFEIQIDPETGGVYPLRVRFLGVERKSAIPADLPLIGSDEVKQARLWLERGFFDRPYAQDFGGRLFRTLFPPALEPFFRESLQRVEPNGGLRVLLNYPLPASLSEIPWELLYDSNGLGFLARSVTAPLVRHYTDLPLPNELPEEGPLHVLVITASPQDKAPVSTQSEIQEIRESFAKASYSFPESILAAFSYWQTRRSLHGVLKHLKQRRLVEMDILPEATRASLQSKMISARNEDRPYHVVHFIGHGEVTDEASQLLLEDGPISADDFAEIIAESSVNLAVLNACETAAEQLLDSVSEACLRRRIPAVIGMQVPVLDRAAVEFAREFYNAWAAGEAIESALAYSRRLINQHAAGSAADWSIPVLYMGPEEGLTLQLEPPPIRVPWQFRAVRWGFAAALSILGAVALLLQVPDIARSVQKQVPIIRCMYPYPLQEDPSFNVAILEFGKQAENGRISRSRDGMVIANDLYKRLNAGLDELDLPISYDLGDQIYPCPITADTPDGINRETVEFAKKIRADILIYGFLIEENGRGMINPEFYVNYQGFQEAEEIAGDHQIGKPLRVELPITENDLELGQNKALKARNSALINLVLGLAEYSLDDYDSALGHFQDASAEKDWLKSQGKEIVYLLIGNTYGRKAGLIREITDQEHNDLLEKARLAYEETLAINSQYARGHLAMAGILYQQSLGDPSTFQVNFDKLSVAEQAFISAQGIIDAPESANILSKAQFGLGQVNIVRAMKALELETGDSSETTLNDVGLSPSVEHLHKAENSFQFVIDDFNAGDERLRDLASQSYANLGYIARVKGDFPAAIEYVKKAVELASPYYRVRFYALLGDTYFLAGETDNAIFAYQDAIDFAETTGDEKTIEEVSWRLESISHDQ